MVETGPSGGWHVVYRRTELVSGNLKLAQRREHLDGCVEVVRFGKSYKPRKDHDGRWRQRYQSAALVKYAQPTIRVGCLDITRVASAAAVAVEVVLRGDAQVGVVAGFAGAQNAV